MNMRPEPRTETTRIAVPVPSHDAYGLTAGGTLAQIALEGQVYTLRITRSGKLILTK